MEIGLSKGLSKGWAKDRAKGWAKGWLAAVTALLMLLIPAAAMAQQFSDSYNFLKAVRGRDGDKATTLLQKPGTTVINTRDPATGQTALHIVVQRRDVTWLGFLLAKGARPDVGDNGGNTPLMLAAQIRFIEGATYLLSSRATIDKPNNQGETPLIRAVQLNDLAMVRLLIQNGANPDKRDTLAGMSAREYAARDVRSEQMTDALSKAKPAAPKGPVQGPGLN